MFAIVYGFANAESHPWTAPSTLGFLAGGVVLLAVFAWWQSRAAHPLLPLRVILDRTRGGFTLAIFIGGIGLFGAFLFLNYYLQQILHYSPIMTGVAFLPMVATLVLTGGVCTTQVYPRVGAKVPVAAGMLIAAGAMAWLTGISPTSSYAADLLGPLMLFGIGIGATGVQAQDAGVASATVNVAQQIGGSVGTALLNSIAAAALTRYLVGQDGTSQTVQADAAAIRGYTVAFWCSSAIFAVGAVAGGLILQAGKPVRARARY